jgi:dTMP kinase
MQERGKFVVFEGPGGSGKGTQIEFSEKLLKANKLPTVFTREPGGIEAAETIRNLIFVLRRKELIKAEGQMVLFFAARQLWVVGVVKPNIDKGVNVLTDRSYASTGAYQGYAEGGDQKTILEIADAIMGDYKPDAVILLDVSRETSLKRRGINTNGDPFDERPPEYFDKVIAGYREMAAAGWGGLNWFMVNGEMKPELVSEEIAKILEDVFHQKLER